MVENFDDLLLMSYIDFRSARTTLNNVANPWGRLYFLDIWYGLNNDYYWDRAVTLFEEQEKT